MSSYSSTTSDQPYTGATNNDNQALDWCFMPNNNESYINSNMAQSTTFQQDVVIEEPTPFDILFPSWTSTHVQMPTSTIKEEAWSCTNNTMNNAASMIAQQQSEIFSYPPLLQQPQRSYTFPPTPPVNPTLTTSNFSMKRSNTINFNEIPMYAPIQQQPSFMQTSRDMTPPSLLCISDSNSPNSTSAIKNKQQDRRKSTGSGTTRTYRRRASSHPSVASVVSLSAHEPVSRIIDGIEYITFLYSHDRLVKEYTVRTDVHHVNLNDIPHDFRAQNAIYPRAHVSREAYDGNRWEYETTCNRLGWEICWLNKEELCGRRGLIQRAVDSYRNRHAEMRSRRVTRQEKVANGTLRKRRAKKAISAVL